MRGGDRTHRTSRNDGGGRRVDTLCSLWSTPPLTTLQKFDTETTHGDAPTFTNAEINMIRTFLKRSLAASAVVAGGGTAYALSDKRTRRSLSFWTKIGPIVGSYVSTGVSFKYLRAKEREENKAKWKADRSAAFSKLHEDNAPKVLQAIIQLRGIVSSRDVLLCCSLVRSPYRHALAIDSSLKLGNTSRYDQSSRLRPTVANSRLFRLLRRLRAKMS